MASKAYIDTIATLAMGKILGEFIMDAYAEKKRNKTINNLCARVKDDANKALHPYLYNPSICQYDAKAQKKVSEKLHKAAVMFEREVDMNTWINFTLAATEGLLHKISEPQRKKAIERLLYGIKAISRHIDRKMNDYNAYESADEFTRLWESA